jgi:transcriptional regulator with XRE-family HTH domain
MARNFRELEAKMGAERIARSDARVKKILAAMPLTELREARNLTQVTLAEILKTSQPAISKIERQTDMYISTLRTMIRAMGGHLQLEAVFPDGRVTISQFSKLRDTEEQAKERRAPTSTQRKKKQSPQSSADVEAAI